MGYILLTSHSTAIAIHTQHCMICFSQDQLPKHMPTQTCSIDAYTSSVPMNVYFQILSVKSIPFFIFIPIKTTYHTCHIWLLNSNSKIYRKVIPISFHDNGIYMFLINTQTVWITGIKFTTPVTKLLKHTCWCMFLPKDSGIILELTTKSKSWWNKRVVKRSWL